MGSRKTDLLNNFLTVSKEAKKMMLESDDIWDKVRPFMNAEDTIFVNLRDIYREGIPPHDFTNQQPRVQRSYTPSSHRLRAN